MPSATSHYIRCLVINQHFRTLKGICEGGSREPRNCVAGTQATSSRSPTTLQQAGLHRTISDLSTTGAIAKVSKAPAQKLSHRRKQADAEPAQAAQRLRRHRRRKQLLAPIDKFRGEKNRNALRTPVVLAPQRRKDVAGGNPSDEGFASLLIIMNSN